MSQPQPMAEFDGHIDEGRELAILHNLLVESTEKITTKSSSELEKLQNVLDGISAALSQPHLHRQMSSPVPSPNVSGRLTSASLPETTAMASITNTYLMGSNQMAACDLNTTDDYVLLAALDSESKPSIDQNCNRTNHPHTLDSDRGLSYIARHTVRPALSAAQHASRLHAARRSFNTPPAKTPVQYSTDPKQPRRQLWKHDENIVDTPDSKAYFASLPHQKMTCHQPANSPNQSLTESLSNKSESPRVVAPLAFNNPLYQPRFSDCLKKRHNSPLSSFSSESDDDIAIVQRSCLGNTGSEPVLVPGNKYCCTSSSSTDNSCESPPRHIKLKSATQLSDNHRLLAQFDRHCQTQPSRSSSDTIGFDQRSQLVHRSSTDSGLHKSFRSTLQPSHYSENLKCAVQNRKMDSPWWKTYPESVEELLHGPLLWHNDHRPLTCFIRTQYEEQVRSLRSVMKRVQKKLQQAEVKLSSQENKTETVISEWSKRMEDEEELIRKHQEEKDQQMKSIITRLTKVENELRNDQKEMQVVITDQQKIIEAQEKKIHTLDATNNHLLSVLSQLRGQYSWHGRNGSTPPFKNNIFHRDPLFKSSSC